MMINIRRKYKQLVNCVVDSQISRDTPSYCSRHISVPW